MRVIDNLERNGGAVMGAVKRELMGHLYYLDSETKFS